MSKRAMGWMGALASAALLLGSASVSLVSLSGARKLLRRPMLASASAAVENVTQVVTPRDSGFLKPKRLDAFEIIGPGGGGTFNSTGISPVDPNLVFAASDMTGCYVSENGGRTWRQFNLRMTCGFVFDPKLVNRIYILAGYAGTWRSDDRGRSWSLLYPDPAAAPKILWADDEAEVEVGIGGGLPEPLSALAVDPDDSDTLYACIASQLQISKDGGKHWKLLTPEAYAQRIWVDPTSPRDRRVLYTQHNNLLGTWDGAKYVRRQVPGTDAINGMAFRAPSEGSKATIYTAGDAVMKNGEVVGGGIQSTDDGGVTWHSLNAGVAKLVTKGSYPNFTTIAASRKHGEVVYVSFTHYVEPNDPAVYYGVIKTADGGATWTVVRKESGVTAANMHDSWISSRFGPDWGDEPLSIAVDDNNPDLVYTGDLGRVMRSVDGGKNWVAAYSQSTGKGYTTTGLDVTTCYGLHFDPFDNKRMFISYTDIGLFRSEDGGESWMSATTKGVSQRWRKNTYWVEFDPEVKGKMWAAMSEMHDLPRHRMLRWVPNARGGVMLSTDGGNSWTVSTQGLPDTAPTHILLDPRSPVSARVLYVAAFGKGVFKSTDGGQNWVAKNNGLPEKEPLAWRMAQDSNGTLYLVTVRRSEDGKSGNEQDGWLFRSRNGADSWERVALPQGVNGPMGITVDPKDSARLYLSAWGRYTLYAAGNPAPDGGVFLSTDAGQHWENVLNGSRRIYDVTVDPRNPDLVYACGFESSAWRSTDRGKTWKRIPGFNFKDGHRVVIDPLDISKIYITTFGSSVWHGPAEGDPSGGEDVAGPLSMTFRAVVPKGN